MGNDYLEGGDGNDIYIWGRGSGNDRIMNGYNQDSSNDTIQLGDGITGSSIEWLQNGDDTILKLKETGETLTIQQWFYQESNKVDTLRFADGTALTSTQVSGLVAVRGSDGNEELSGSDYWGDTMYGGAGDDTLHGRAGNDTVSGGNGNDTLYGDAGNDLLDGGSGNDTYLWGKESGNDSISNSGASGDNDVVQLGEEITADDLEVLRNNSNLFLKIKSTSETLTFNNWFSGSANQVTKVQFADGTAWITAELNSRVTMQGTANAETLYGLDNSNDKIYGLGGNDTIHGYTGDDVLDGGDGDDTLYGRASWNSSGSGNDTLYGGTGSDTLYGQDGNDMLYGGAGNDYLDGGAGNDYLQGGAGNDTYVFGLGSGNDTVNSYEEMGSNGFDTLQFQNLVQAAIEFNISGSDLICTLTQTGETMQLTNWILGTNYQVDQFRFTDGTLTAVQINQRVA